MGLTFRLGQLPTSLFTDTSNNVGIGGSPSGSYKLEVTGTGRFSGVLTATELNLTGNAAVTNTTTAGYLALYGNTGGMYLGAYNAGAYQNYMRITATGNVGIGTTSPSKLLHLYNTAGTDVMLVESTQVFSTIAFKSSTNSSTVTIGIDGAGNAAIENKLTTGAMAFVTNGNERLRITSAGNVGIGNTNPQLKLDIRTGSLGIYHNTTGSNGAQIYLGDSNFQGGTYATSAPGIGAIFNSASGVASDLGFYVYTGVEASRTERMRILSSGNVGINTTSPAGRFQVNGAGGSDINFQLNDGSSRRVFCVPSQYYGYIFAISVAADGGKGISFGNGGGAAEVGSIVCNSSSISINYSSDYRLKEDLKDFNGIDVLSKIKLYNFRWKAEQTRDYGVIAHELKEIMPTMVTGEKDALTHEDKLAPQGVDYIKFVPILIKAIQELNEKLIRNNIN